MWTTVDQHVGEVVELSPYPLRVAGSNVPPLVFRYEIPSVAQSGVYDGSP